MGGVVVGGLVVEGVSAAAVVVGKLATEEVPAAGAAGLRAEAGFSGAVAGATDTNLLSGLGGGGVDGFKSDGAGPGVSFVVPA